MTEYAIVDDDMIVEFREFSGDPPVLSGKPYRKILPVEVTSPPYDPITQTRSGPVVTILTDKVTRVWSVTNKTQQEIDAEADVQKDAQLTEAEQVNKVLFRALFNHENRIRALESKPAITVQQFKTGLKALL